MTPCVITIRFPVRVPLEENPIIISFRAINATETEEASGQSIVARNHELIARWTNEGQARDITSENRFVSAIIHRWKISAYCWKKINFQYKVHDETRPRLLAIFFSFFFKLPRLYPFTPLIIFPRHPISTSLIFYHLSVFLPIASGPLKTRANSISRLISDWSGAKNYILRYKGAA